MTTLPLQPPDPTEVQPEKGESLWSDAWRRLRKNRMALAGGVFVLVFLVLSFLAPVIAPYGLDEQNLSRAYEPPSWDHWLGTDQLGRDLFSRILYGGRVSFGVGVVATLVSVVIGILYGALSGFVGGKTDNLMMRFVDVLYSLPYMFFVIVLMVVFGRDLIMLFIALGAVSWLSLARIVRGQVLSLKEKEFVLAAVSVGATKGRIITRHVIPNVLGPVIVYATLEVPAVMLAEAFLSFLGLGVQEPNTSWGALANEGAKALHFPWLILFPGLALAIVLFSLNFLGDGLRDALDPQLRR